MFLKKILNVVILLRVIYIYIYIYIIYRHKNLHHRGRGTVRVFPWNKLYIGARGIVAILVFFFFVFLMGAILVLMLKNMQVASYRLTAVAARS